MRIPFSIALIAVLAFAGCVCRPAPENLAGNPNTVCILSGNNEFKKEVAGKLTAALEARGLTVVRDGVNSAGRHRADKYSAVVYFAEFRMGHVQHRATSYFKHNGQAPNIVFVITAGDPKQKVTKPFDAVSTASVMTQSDAVANEIMARLDAVLKK